jgi:hypothetical protein
MVLAFLLSGFIISFWSTSSFSQTVFSQQQAASVLGIEKVAAEPDGTVTGEIRNNSKNRVRDVQLFIPIHFYGKMSFIRARTARVQLFTRRSPGRYLPGGSLPFKFTPSPPLPKRTDGRFEAPSVSIAGFTEIIPQSR